MGDAGNPPPASPFVILMDTFISLDTETTGLSFTDDRIIQFGCSVFLNKKCVARKSFYIAETAVPNNGFHVNGITPDMIASGFDPEYAYVMIATIMHKYPRLVLAYNAPFDLTFLATAFRRFDIPYDFNTLSVIDPLVIARHYYPPFYNNKLVSVCDRYRVPYENTHDAADDSEAAGHVFNAQRVWHGIRGPISALQTKQLRWYTSWKDGFVAYHSARGRTVTVNDWPYSEEIACSANELSTLF
jgi:DNA polymerase III alpha subunit (gram-positive type)